MLCFERNSVDKCELIRTRRTLEGAEKWFFLFFLREEVTALLNFMVVEQARRGEEREKGVFSFEG